MDTIRSLLGAWQLTPDVSIFTDRPEPKACDWRCEHPPFTTFDAVLDFDVNTPGTNCLIIPEDYEDPLENLYNAALDIRGAEKGFQKDLFKGSTFHLNVHSNLPVIGLNGATFREHGHNLFRERLRRDLDATFEDFKKACQVNAGMTYSKNGEMVYVRMKTGFAQNAPYLMIDELYEIIETRKKSDPIFKVPSWALNRTLEGELSDSPELWDSYVKYQGRPALLAKFPVDAYTDARPDDGAEFMEIFKVLACEMPLSAAAAAARAL